MLTANCPRELSTFSAPQRLIIGKDGRGGGERGGDLLDRLDGEQLERLILNLVDDDGSTLSGVTPKRFASAAATNY